MEKDFYIFVSEECKGGGDRINVGGKKYFYYFTDSPKIPKIYQTLENFENLVKSLIEENQKNSEEGVRPPFEIIIRSLEKIAKD